MTREQAMEWILPVLCGVDAAPHLPQLAAGPSSPKQTVGASAVAKTTRMAAEMEWHAAADPNVMKPSDEQQYVVDLVKQGYNVFFTGAAGVPRFISLFFFWPLRDPTQARASRSVCGRSSVFFVSSMECKACLSPPVQALQR